MVERLHARYPFLRAARDAAVHVDLADAVDRPAVVERAVDRLDHAITDGRVGPPHRDSEVELLSYPVARILVSLLDNDRLLDRYVRAEAATAHRRFTDDFETSTELASVSSTGIDRDTLLDDLDLDAVRPKDSDEYVVPVADYLRLAPEGSAWKLVNRALADGVVPVDEQELSILAREAVAERVDERLPVSVPDAISEPLSDAVIELRKTLVGMDLQFTPGETDIDAFPPCMDALLAEMQEEGLTDTRSLTVLTSFCAAVGMDTDEIVSLFDSDNEFIRSFVEQVCAEPESYAPPTCATMQATGDCVNKDDLCERIERPLAYYEESV